MLFTGLPPEKVHKSKKIPFKGENESLLLLAGTKKRKINKAGGILWFVLYRAGYLASISGLVGVFCAVKGYTVFAKTKNESKLCMILSAVISVAVLVLAWYLCVGYDIYLAYQDWFAAGEVDFTLTFGESMETIPYFFEESEILASYLKDPGLGLLFAGIGIVYYMSIREKKKKAMAAQAAAQAAQTVVQEAVVQEDVHPLLLQPSRRSTNKKI